MNKSILTTIVILSFLILSGCKDEAPKNENVDFILYVSNQSYDVSPVDITIYIDDVIVVEGEYEIGDSHNWKSFDFNLLTGKHTIKVESQKGEASLVKNFELTDDMYWAVIDYWQYSENTDGENTVVKRFSWLIQNEAIYFM